MILGGMVPRIKQSGIYAIENTVNGKLLAVNVGNSGPASGSIRPQTSE